VPRRAGGRGPILVADADRRSREETARALLNAGYEVVEAATGEEAVDAARRAEPALAVLEVRLPGLSGYEVCRRLREERGDAVPIVFVSGDRVEPSDRVAGLLVGADDYLAKPLASDELVARVRRQLERTDASGRDGPPDRLTAREYEVLRLLASGLVPAQIASALSISPRTVATHVEHIYVKLGVHSRAHAVAAAFRLALVD
jgi:DNA-binding NarL/FixJ family response regulator